MKPPCGAKTRSGFPCRKQAGWGTNHLGQGRCRLHGGKVGRQLKHGRYSKVMRETIGELVERVEAEVDPLDVLPEIALMRALLVDWLERYSELQEAVLNWNASVGQETADGSASARPKDVPDIGDVGPLMETVSRMVYRAKMAQQTRAISKSDFYRVMQELGRVVEKVVTDPGQREQIREGWLSIHLA